MELISSWLEHDKVLSAEEQLRSNKITHQLEALRVTQQQSQQQQQQQSPSADQQNGFDSASLHL
jgi:hypothetical protein